MPMKVLVVAAHPDDEVLGCGGTIVRHVRQGDTVSVIYMADGCSAREGDVAAAQATRRLEAGQAQAILGIEDVEYLGFPDNRMDGLPLLDLVRPLESVIGRRSPDIVYTHHGGDLNVDHRLTHRAVMTACRPQPGCGVREIYAFEVLSSTGWQSPDDITFRPNVFVDITDCMAVKRAALEAYASEMRAYPHARSVENAGNLAGLRGATVGRRYAEAFELLRAVR